MNVCWRGYIWVGVVDVEWIRGLDRYWDNILRGLYVIVCLLKEDMFVEVCNGEVFIWFGDVFMWMLRVVVILVGCYLCVFIFYVIVIWDILICRLSFWVFY